MIWCGVWCSTGAECPEESEQGSGEELGQWTAQKEPAGGEESWPYPEDPWASSLSFGRLICGNGSVDLSCQGLGSGLRAISM